MNIGESYWLSYQPIIFADLNRHTALARHKAQMPAIHQVLRTPGILSEICLHLAPGGPTELEPYVEVRKRKIHRTTLARLAQVCRAFCAPALDVLWRILEDVLPVLRVLPPLTHVKVDKNYVCSQRSPVLPWTPKADMRVNV